MIYDEGTTVGNTGATYSDVIFVTPDVIYSIKLEVLRSDLEAASEKVSEIKFDGNIIGECNPPGPDDACDFYECGSGFTFKEISSTTGRIDVVLKYVGHSHDCDCDKTTWECSPEAMSHSGYVSGRSNMVAAARITLTPKLNTKGTIK